jgi:hypothetical protein
MPPRVRRAASAATRAGSGVAPARRPTAIVSLQDQTAPRHRNWCFYGESDTGKTVLAGTAPNALFLSTDIEGTESAREMGSTAKELRINAFEEFINGVDWLVRGGGTKEFEFVVVDTADELEVLAWESQLVNDDLKRASKYQPNKGDYPVVWAKVKEQLMLLARAPINVIYLAHTMRIDRETEDGEDTVTLAMPAMGSRKRGDLSSAFCAQMGLVGYYRKVMNEEGEQVRQLLTQSSSRWIARDRSNRFGAGITNPTVPTMLAKLATAPATATTTRRTRRRAG